MRCPKCNSSEIIKAGNNVNYRREGNQFIVTGFKQRYICKKCRHITVNPVMDS
jgi:transposase-like protein